MTSSDELHADLAKNLALDQAVHLMEDAARILEDLGMSDLAGRLDVVEGDAINRLGAKS